MSLSEIWARLEADAPRERTGRMVQRIRPESATDLFATLELDGGTVRGRRALELQVGVSSARTIDPPAGSRAVECRIEPRPGERTALVLRLIDDAARDLFAAMCEDVAAATSEAEDDGSALSAWVGRFAKWRRMLQGGSRGLSGERQRGLFAELRTIREQLLPTVGFDEAVRAWRGPDGAPRDFEVGGCGIEVKASAANEPQVVAINGERQLDDSGLRSLLLVHESLEVLRDAGQSLPQLVADLRSIGEGQPESGMLEDRLLQSGYADVHEPLYRRTGYSPRRTSFFEVRDGFPRITEDHLADGVGSVHYRLAIDACRAFEVPRDLLVARLTQAQR